MEDKIKSLLAYTYKYIRDAVIPKSVFGALGQIFTALSLFYLLRYSLGFGLIPTFDILISVYLRAVELTIGWLDPIVLRVSQIISDLFEIEISINPEWRHIYLVLQMLFIRDAGTALADGRKLLAAVRATTGTIVALLCGILFITSESSPEILSNISLFITPIFGLFAYDVIMYFFSATTFFHQIGVGEHSNEISRTRFFVNGLYRSVSRFLVVSIPSVIAFAMTSLWKLGFPKGGIIALLFGVIVNCFYWLIYAGRYAFIRWKTGEDFQSAFVKSEAGRFGLAISGVVFWVFMFCVINTAGRLLEL